MAQDDATILVQAVIDLRRARQGSFPLDLFMGEQGWDILLQLFVADANGERLTARDLLSRTGGPAAAGERWIRFLASRGLTVGDGDGRLDDVVTATPEALQRVESWAASSIAALEHLIKPRIAAARRRF